jgi:hypothetical protein
MKPEKGLRRRRKEEKITVGNHDLQGDASQCRLLQRLLVADGYWVSIA